MSRLDGSIIFVFGFEVVLDVGIMDVFEELGVFLNEVLLEFVDFVFVINRCWDVELV